MKLNRREFVATGLASVAGLAVGGYPSLGRATAPPVDEDGYKLWLRYAPPGRTAAQYHRFVRDVRVDGTSATCGIIRDELLAATNSMLGRGSVAARTDKGLVNGT